MCNRLRNIQIKCKMSKKYLKIHERDNVAVALQNLPTGTLVQENTSAITLQEAIAAKHKFTLLHLDKGSEIRMYGVKVGRTTETLPAGTALTTTNVVHKAESISGRQSAPTWEPVNVEDLAQSTFMGYHRPDGQVGTLNNWLVIPLVFCENRNVEVLKEAFTRELGFEKPNPYQDYIRELVAAHTAEKKPGAQAEQPRHRLFKNIDGMKFLTHQGGCGGTRNDASMLCKLIAGYLVNPNVGGATILSLGCQNAQVDMLKQELALMDPHFSKPLFIIEQQVEGTEQAFFTKAIKQTFAGLQEIGKLQRAPAPLSKLTLGLECGGSDGFSGISANPVVGYVSDLVVSLGGKTMLAEFPELCGVEQDLINRSVDEEVAEKFSGLMQAYELAAERAGSGFDMNPSPGNIKDGLITDAMKSAGAAKKGGTSPVQAVLDYGQYATSQGLNLLCTPGNDVESTTALAGSGANVILFTTGLGTPTGNPVTPVLKISSNDQLAKRMPDIIDFNTGDVISAGRPIKESARDLLKLIIAVASGERESKAQQNLQEDFIPWKRDISL